MSSDVLANVPAGSDVFVDANILVAFTGISTQCKDFLTRCAGQDVIGISSHEVINETTHRLMIHEEFQKGLIAVPRVRELQKHPAVVQGLTDYWVQISQVFNMNLLLVAADESVLQHAQLIRSAHGLLTLDSVLVATMEQYGIRSLASHDTDFDLITSVTRYYPSDVP